MTSPARVAVIGCGAIAHEHLRYLSASPKVDLVAVCDRSPITAEFVRDRFKADKAFTDVAETLAASRADVVHILTPPNSHEALVKQALAAGANVICEKPLSANANVSASMLDSARTADRWLIESRNLLFNDEILRTKHEIAVGSLGEVREVEVSISLDILPSPFGDTNLEGPGVDLPAGAIHDFLPHMVYLVLDLLDAPDEDFETAGTLTNLSGNPRIGCDFLDCVLRTGHHRGRLRFASDINPASFRVIVRGTKGVLETDLYRSFVRLQTEKWSGKLAPFEAMSSGYGLFKSGARDFTNKVSRHDTYHGLRRMLDVVYSAVAAGQAPPITAAEILSTARLVDKVVALRSAS